MASNPADWIGRQIEFDDALSPWPACALVRSFELPARRALVGGDALPPLWHWLYFLSVDPIGQLGEDGHAARGEGGFLPPIDLPRRMWARGRLAWHKPMLIGSPHRKSSQVRAINHKQGRSGPLTFVEVEHRVTDELGQLCLTEIHDIVYREAQSSATQGSAKTEAAFRALEFEGEVEISTVQLFRYSALTFNSHRIHYDADYARAVEGYPGLIVHGPLIATLAMEQLATAVPRFQPIALDFKMVAPVFLISDAPCSLTIGGWRNEDGSVALEVRNDGRRCLTATVHGE